MEAPDGDGAGQSDPATDSARKIPPIFSRLLSEIKERSFLCPTTQEWPRAESDSSIVEIMEEG
jgi:hypothetical protein